MSTEPSDAVAGGHLDIRESPLVQGAAEAERPTRWWAGWLFVIGVCVFFVSLGLGSGVNAVLGNPASGSPLSQLGEMITFAIDIAIIALWVVKKERRPFSSVGFRGSKRFGRVAIGFGIGIAAFVIPTLVLLAAGQLGDGRSPHTRSGVDALLMAGLLLLPFVVQSTGEEILTRGYMLQIGGIQLPSWVAIVGSSFLFAAVHLDFHPVPLLNITLYAVMVCFIALGQGSLWLVCGFHIAWNWVQGNVLGIAVSGGPREVAVFTLGPTQGASELLTGGTFGLEGSLAVTVVLAALLVGSFAYYRRCAAQRAGT